MPSSVLSSLVQILGFQDSLLFKSTTSVAACCIVAWLWLRNRRCDCLPLPPGPRKLPFVGNLFQFPTQREWETFTRWSKEYSQCLSFHDPIYCLLIGLESPLLHLDICGQSIIIVNSYKIASELLDKRAINYSGRYPDPFYYSPQSMALK